MSDNWDKCFPVNAVYIKAVPWEELPPEAQEDFPPGTSHHFIIFNREGELLDVTYTRNGAKNVALENNSKIFALH